MAFYKNEQWPEKSEYYRWPWSNNDNPISWLEVTDICNIYCKGCYRANLSGERPLEELKKEVDLFKQMRNASSISIAGGEPLLHKDIVPLVKYIAEKGMLPTIISNISLLTKPLLQDLYKAGLTGITCHIDMLQERPEFEKGSTTELDIMPLRQKTADLIYEVGKGNISCTFNSTIYHQNFEYIPEIVKWMRENPKKVHGVVFITYRGIPLDENITWDVPDKRNETLDEVKNEIRYVESDLNQIDIESTDVYSYLRDHFGENVELTAYLGGTGHIKHYKWMGLVTFIEANSKIIGPMGSRTMEFLQMDHHFRKGTYFAYKQKNTLSRFVLLATAFIGDKKMHKTRLKLLPSLLNPIKWFQPVYAQSIGIVQAPDMMDNGTASMCESCPDMCVFEGNLVNSCRLDEYRKYGKMMTAIIHSEDTDKRQNPVTAGNSD